MSQMLRKDVPEEETWDLTPIFYSVEEWEQSFKITEVKIDNLLAGKDVLPVSKASDLLESLQFYDNLMQKLNRISSYAKYKFSEDESDTENQEMMGRSLSLVAKSGQVTTNFMNDLLQVDKVNIQKWKNEEEGLHEFSRFLNRLDEVRDHMLTPEVEEILATLSETLHVPETIFHAVTSSDMRFESVKDKHGKEHSVSLH